MEESTLFDYISRDLNIYKGDDERPELWHCRIAYSVSAIHGLNSLWEQEKQYEGSISLDHIRSAIDQTLACFRKLFPHIEDSMGYLDANKKLSIQIQEILLNGGCLYYNSPRVAPVVMACAFENKSEISFLRGICPGHKYSMSGAGYYQEGISENINRDILSMFNLQILLTQEELNQLWGHLHGECRSLLENYEFLCLSPEKFHNGYWKNRPDKNILSLMRKRYTKHSYSLYYFDGHMFHCRLLPEYWNTYSRYLFLVASLLNKKIAFFKIRHKKNLVTVKPNYLLPPAEEAFFRLYSWPDFDINQEDRGHFTPRIMSKHVYDAFHNILTHLGYHFQEVEDVERCV